MMLMPTNCWKAASAIPIQTTGASRPPRIKSDKRGRCSPRRLCSTCRISASASPPMRAKTRRASFRLPWATRKRGDSGMSNTPARNATDGTASIQNIQRHAGAPSQKVAPAPPANRARMSLLRKAQNNPDTIAICCSEGESTAHLRRSYFRDVHRRQHAGGADGQTAHEPRDDEHAGRARQAGGGGAEEKQNSVQQHRWTPAVTVGNRSRDEGADSTTKQHRGDSKAGGRRPRAEGVGQRVDRSIDDAAVKTEEKSAERSDGAQRDHVGRALRRALDRRRAGGLQDAAGHVSVDASYRFVHGQAPSRTAGGWCTSEVDPGFESDHERIGDSARPSRPNDVLEVRREVDRVLEEPKAIGQLERGLVPLNTHGRIRLPRASLRVFLVVAEATVHDAEAHQVGGPRREHTAGDQAGGAEEGHDTAD